MRPRDLSRRGQDWQTFSDRVLEHIETYTVPQYGDRPHDQMMEFSVADCATQIKRYLNRLGSNARGAAESRRDMLKVAHYAQVIWWKLGEGNGEFPDTGEKQ